MWKGVPFYFFFNAKSRTEKFSRLCPPEEVGCSNNHVLEVLKWQTSVIVQVSLIYDFLAHHPHLFLGQLVPCQFVQGLLQVWLAYEVVIVKILPKKGKNNVK